MSYHIIDTKTGLTVATASTRRAARRKADRLDLEYGAIRYAVRFVAPYGIAEPV